METKSTVRNILFVMLAGLLLSACNVGAAEPVLALEPTSAPSETNTPLPAPTQTLVPASPTASRMEFSVQNATFEVKVIDIEKPARVYPGGDTVFTPGAGNMFLGLGIKVSNLTGSDISLKWSDLYLVNKYQDRWYPIWGAYQKTNTLVDPLTVPILEFQVVDPEFDPDAHVYFGDNGYVRVIYRVPKDNLYYYFGFFDLPLVEINYRYH